MGLTAGDVQLIMQIVRQMMHEQQDHKPEHGVAYTGSWLAQDSPPYGFANTFEVTAGKTAAILGDDGDTGFAHQRVDVFSTAYGDIYAPRGGERVVMLQTEATPIAGFIHGTDSNGVSDADSSLIAGERSMRHFNVNADVDVYIKIKNDGPTAGDGLGSLLALVGALLKVTTTGGTTLVVDDATGTTQLGGSGGMASGEVMGNALVRQSDIVVLLEAIQTKLDAWASTNLQAGSGATGPTTLTTIMPTASSKTFTA